MILTNKTSTFSRKCQVKDSQHDGAILIYKFVNFVFVLLFCGTGMNQLFVMDKHAQRQNRGKETVHYKTSISEAAGSYFALVGAHRHCAQVDSNRIESSSMGVEYVVAGYKVCRYKT